MAELTHLFMDMENAVLYMSQSMLGKQIWKYSLALLQLLDSTIKQPSGGLYGLVIYTKDFFQCIKSQ